MLIEKPSSPSKPTPIPAAAVTALPTQEERPVNQNVFKFTPITFDKPQGTTDKTFTADQIKSDAQRRLERMKRFGVKASEEEMKQLRAARFGTTTETPKATEKSKTTPVTKKETVAKKLIKKDTKPNHLPKHSLNSKSVMTKKKNRTGPLLKNTNLNQIVTQIHQKKNKLIPTVNRKRLFLNNKVDHPWIVKNKEKKRVVTAEKNTVIGNGRIITFETNQQKPSTTQRNMNNHKRTIQVNNKRKVHVQENNHNMNLVSCILFVKKKKLTMDCRIQDSRKEEPDYFAKKNNKNYLLYFFFLKKKKGERGDEYKRKEYAFLLQGKKKKRKESTKLVNDID